MISFIVTTLVCFITYLLLTTGSGKDVFGLWSRAELIFGIILSIIVGVVGRKIFVKKSFRMLNPVRWFAFLAYLPVFFVSMAKANFDVAYRVITGKINPGIVKISPDLKTDLGISMLANSITLTPGTLSVDIEENSNDLYIHWINVKEEALKKKPVDCKYICGSFPKWVRRIAE
ncbi:MAG TPA: cation:proton antiporter [Bacteroidetes bacterium]|nr:cation:proton antiporter [Bacteroidota bacterium]